MAPLTLAMLALGCCELGRLLSRMIDLLEGRHV